MSSGTSPRTSRSTRRRRAQPRIRSLQPPSPKTLILHMFSYGFPPGPVAVRGHWDFPAPSPSIFFYSSPNIIFLTQFPLPPRAPDPGVGGFYRAAPTAADPEGGVPTKIPCEVLKADRLSEERWHVESFQKLKMLQFRIVSVCSK